MQALDRLGEYSKNVPKSEESDFTRRWNKARQKILKGESLWEGLVKMSAASAADYEFLQGKDPLFVTNYFIAKMVQQ